MFLLELILLLTTASVTDNTSTTATATLTNTQQLANIKQNKPEAIIGSFYASH